MGCGLVLIIFPFYKIGITLLKVYGFCVILAMRIVSNWIGLGCLVVVETWFLGFIIVNFSYNEILILKVESYIFTL